MWGLRGCECELTVAHVSICLCLARKFADGEGVAVITTDADGHVTNDTDVDEGQRTRGDGGINEGEDAMLALGSTRPLLKAPIKPRVIRVNAPTRKQHTEEETSDTCKTSRSGVAVVQLCRCLLINCTRWSDLRRPCACSQ